MGLKDQDNKFMREAIALARSQMGVTSPDPMVGAVIVKNGKIISKGYHARQSTPHAEAVAVRKAGGRTKGATLYQNLEPCNHYGFNPPCTDQIVKAGIKRVVAAMEDPNPLVAGKGFKALKKAGIKLTIGVMKEEAQRLNEAFTKHITTDLPFVILKSAMSLDGKIATVTKDSKYITNKLSRQYVHQLRVYVDAVMTTVNTVKIDDPKFTVRDIGRENIVMRNPKKIIIDAYGEIPLRSYVIKHEPQKTIVVVGSKAPKNKIAAIRKAGAVVIEMPCRDSNIDLKKLMVELGEDRIMSIMIEGGGSFAASALKSGIVDKVLFFIAPKIIGGREAVTPVEGRGIRKLSSAIDLKDVNIRKFGSDVLIEGYVR